MPAASTCVSTPNHQGRCLRTLMPAPSSPSVSIRISPESQLADTVAMVVNNHRYVLPFGERSTPDLSELPLASPSLQIALSRWLHKIPLQHRADTWFSRSFSRHLCLRSRLQIFPKKGGDPAAPSGTATLLRLRPSHQTHPRQLSPCG